MDLNKLIREHFAKFFKKPLKDTDNLFELGALDSMGIVNLISYIENEAGLTIDAEEITEDNFATINSITELLSKKK